MSKASDSKPVPGWYGSEPAESMPEDPYTGFRKLRESQPVNLTPEGNWRLTRYEDVRRLLRSPDAGMRRTDGLLPGQTTPVEEGGRFMLLQDGDTHTRLRKLVAKAFTPRAIESWRERIVVVTNALLDRVASQGEMDLVADFARPVPATLICELLGVPPEDQDKFTNWTADATHGLLTIRGVGDDESRARVEAASVQLIGYFQNLIDERRKNLDDDLLSTLITAEEEGDRLDPIELLSNSVGLLIAGFETTIGLIGNGLTTLIRHPEELERLRAHPEWNASAVEECLRYSGPILASVRVLHKPHRFGGYQIETNDEVVAMLAAANRDPEVFDDPERFDVSRYAEGKNTPDHLSFGGGAHFCLGAHLARLESQIAIGTLVRRFTDLELVDEKTEWGRSRSVKRRSPQERSQRVFGGQVVGQALVAAERTVDDRICHSLKGDFLRPGDPKTPILYEVDRIRDGKSFCTRRVVAIQHGKAIFSMTVGFQVEEDGPDHQMPMPEMTQPEDLPDPEILRAEVLERVPDEYRHWYEGESPFEQLTIDPVDPFDPEKRPPHMAYWLRTAGELPDSIALHQCLLAYASDMNLLDTCILPHGISWMDPKFQSASLDHSIWFHSRFRADEWLLFVQDAPRSAGSRGFNRGLVYTRDGRLIASVAQEGLTRYHE